MMRRPSTLVEVAAAATIDTDAFQSTLAGFLDDFYMNVDRRQAMIDVEPPFTSVEIHDAYLGAVAEHLARRWGLEVPAWTRSERRRLHRPRFMTKIEALKPLLLAQSPLAFRKRMIFVEAEPLRRARMPKG